MNTRRVVKRNQNNTKLKIITLLAVLIIIIICVPIGVSVGKKIFSPILLKEDSIHVEIHNKLDLKANIERVKKGTVKDVEIDDSKLKLDTLGEYPIIYKIGDKEKEIIVHVVDTKKPKFNVTKAEFCENYKIDANALVSDVQDATKTKAYMKEKYKLKAGKTQNVIVVVEDEAGNKTEKKTKIKVLPKDTTPPTIKETSELRVTIGNKIEYIDGLSISDDYDKNPNIKVDDTHVKLDKLGKYKVKYRIRDKAGNTSTLTRTLHVVKEYPREIKESNKKILYLTFDDGPSNNTGRILDVLDKYNIKATFFVTGTHPEYNHFIKKAHDKGHTIGLHTYTHDYAQLYSSMDAYFADLNKVGNMVKKITGEFPRFIRFPGGSSNMISSSYSPGIMTNLTQEVLNRGFQYYDWNADSTDATGNNVPVSQIIANATAYGNNNLNILFHDTDAKDTTVEALPAIIEHYLSLGYEIKGIDNKSFTPHHGVNN